MLKTLLILFLLVSCANTDNKTKNQCCLNAQYAQFYFDECKRHIEEKKQLRTQIKAWDETFILLMQYRAGQLDSLTVLELLRYKEPIVGRSITELLKN